ncbi:MAG: hypothetical protein M3R24_08240 [Chloroflexota bacterium]|nr:hypothetical protein [Chloroflexota bacterium]
MCCQRCSRYEQADETALGRVQTCPNCDGPLMLRWSVLLVVPGDRYPQQRDFVAMLYRPPRHYARRSGSRLTPPRSSHRPRTAKFHGAHLVPNPTVH